MALAPYFDKAALSAANLLAGFDLDAFRMALEQHVVGIGFDVDAGGSLEGRLTLELLTDLLARLYPTLALVPLSDDLASETLAIQLGRSATAINPCVDLTRESSRVTVWVVVGRRMPPSEAPVTYVGSQGWNATVSIAHPVGSSQTANPYGAGAAACFGAAAVFRTIFRGQLDPSDEGNTSPASMTEVRANPIATSSALTCATLPWTVGKTATLSILTSDVVAGTWEQSAAAGPTLPEIIPIGETYLVGAGAIGHAALWALARTPGIAGTLHVIDPERIDETNPQRYLTTTCDDIGMRKVDAAARLLAKGASSALSVVLHATAWDGVAAASADYRFDRVLLALDSARDRVAVQTSLPRWIANAWTQPENLGVSRHPQFGDGPCVGCLYQPSGARRSLDVLVAEAIGWVGDAELMEVRTLLHSGQPVGTAFVRRVAERLGIPGVPLLPLADMPLDAFYARAVCAGLTLRLGAEARSRIEVPMAFQSALAGILLAAELVADGAHLRIERFPPRTEINLLRPIGTRLTSPASADPSGPCICHDAIFLGRYASKYALRDNLG